MDNKETIILYSNSTDSNLILSYIYDNLKKINKNIKGIYLETDKEQIREYGYKGKKKFIHLIAPENGIYELDGIIIDIHDYKLQTEIAILKHKTLYYVIKEIILTGESIEKINKFIENAILTKNQEIENINSISKDKIKKKSFMKYGWINHSFLPKRDINTIFLKEGQLDLIKNKLLSFLDKSNYNDYIKHGIPYKYNILLKGTPGVGKTSLIHAIASICNANICMLNINQELKENDMIDAFRSVNDEEGLSIIVIEDIDCIFYDRKNLDTHKNNITLNGLLNCMDGFNNQEGLIVIITTNHPEKLDEALLRSGRIDLDVELTYVDKYQARNMFLSFFKDENDFNELWEQIKKYDIEPSTFLQFLFNNRKSDNIKLKYNELIDILYKKNSTILNLYS